LRWLKFLLLAIGLGLLIFIVSNINLQETVELLRRVGMGFGLILLIYFLAFLIDTFTWHLTLTDIPITSHWIHRLFQLRLIGESFNNLTPLAGMGGEPLKAILLNKNYGVSYQDGVASLILAKTINVIALIMFLASGFFFVLESDELDFKYKTVATVGLISLSIGVFLFFFVQRFKLTSTAGNFLSKFEFLSWLVNALEHVEAVENRLVTFYTEQRERLLLALLFALANWLLGVVEIFYTMQFLGHPIGIIDAWIIESVVQLVRAGTFFIPASIGVQEGAFVILGAAIGGSPTTGFAVAVVRRIREFIWMGLGIIVLYFLKSDYNTADFQQARKGKYD